MADLMGDFGGTFPFEPRFVEVNGVRLHYVEAGRGEPILLCHGNPTWSYLYREFLPPLAEAGFRAIALDYLGFGRSDKPDDHRRYTLENHIDNTRAFIEALDLRDLTVVGQDWGGPIGFGAAIEVPDRVKRLVAMNTWAFVFPEGTEPPTFLRPFLERGTGEMLCLGANLFVEAGIPGGIAGRSRVATDELMGAYRAPFPTYWSRVGILAFPRMIPFSASHPSAPVMQRVHDGLSKLDVPLLVVWGMRDRVFPPTVIEFWRSLFPEATVVEIAEAGHYLQEDAPEEICRAIVEFCRANP